MSTGSPPVSGLASTALVVDDNSINRYMLVQQVTQLGHRAAAAENGREALEKLRRESFDLVLLDVMMPEMDGYAVLEAMKADRRLREIPVIVVSGLDEIESVVRCIERGAEDYLTKPYNPTLLRARIHACLDKKRLRDQEVALHRELERNYQQLKELEALRDSLTRMVVHDLRQPLQSLMGGLQTLEILGDLNEEQREFLTMSVSGAETLLGMINDLLDISKMEDGSLRLDYSELAPSALVADALRHVQHLAREKELALHCEIGEDLPVIPADPEKLRRTLVNLLGNAVKFTPTGGRLTVAARALEEEPALLFSVEDTGEGIPEEAFDRIFEKFAQVETRKAGRRNSTGLGLTFCKMAVEAHGGRIWVRSRLGEGSTFLFTVPLRQRM